MYKSGEDNETHSDFFGFKSGESCDLVVSLAEFEAEILVLEELAVIPLPFL